MSLQSQRYGRIHRSGFKVADLAVTAPRPPLPHLVLRRGCWYCTGPLEPAPGVTLVIGHPTPADAFAEYCYRAQFRAGIPLGLAL